MADANNTTESPRIDPSIIYGARQGLSVLKGQISTLATETIGQDINESVTDLLWTVAAIFRDVEEALANAEACA